MLAHNLIVLFERKLGWLEAVTLGSLRFWMFATAGVVSQPQGQTIKNRRAPARTSLVAIALG